MASYLDPPTINHLRGESLIEHYVASIEEAEYCILDDEFISTPVEVGSPPIQRHRLGVLDEDGAGGLEPDLGLVRDIARLLVPGMGARGEVIEAVLKDIFGEDPPASGSEQDGGVNQARAPDPGLAAAWQPVIPQFERLDVYGRGRTARGAASPLAPGLAASARQFLVALTAALPAEAVAGRRADLRAVVHSCLKDIVPDELPAPKDGPALVEELGELLRRTGLADRPRLATAVRIGEIFGVEKPPGSDDPATGDDPRYARVLKRRQRSAVGDRSDS